MKYCKNVSVLVLLVGAACSLKSPQAPSWHTTLNVPLVNRLYTVAELLQDQKNVVFDENGRLGFQIEESIDAGRIGDNFKLAGFEQSFQVGLPDLQLPAFSVSYDRFLFNQMCPEVAGKEGQKIVVHSCTYQRLAGQSNSDPNFHSATIAKGIGWLLVYNRLPVALENVTLQLRDGSTGDITINAPRITRINANDSVIVKLMLDGKRFPASNQWLISGSIPGSGGSSVSIQSNQVVEVVTQIDQVQVSRIEAKIPGLSLVMTKSIELFPGMTIAVDELAFQKGTVTITLDNKTPFSSSEFELLFDHIINSNTGTALIYSMSLQPFAKTVHQLDLHQFVARLDLPPNGAQQFLNVDISGSTEDLGDRFISLDEKSTITANVAFSDLVIDHLSGRLTEQQVVLDTMRKSITLPDRLDDLDNVRFGEAKMTMDIYNSVQLPIRFEGKLQAFNSKGDYVYFTVNEQIKPGSATGEVRTRIPVFTSQNSDIVKFMDIRPNLFIATGRAWVGDGLTYGKVTAGDYIRANVMVEMPAKVSWTSQEVHLDTTQINIKPLNAAGELYDNGEINQISGDLTGNLVSAKITAKIENHLPVGGALQLQLADALARLYDKPNLVLGPIKLPAAATDAIGRVLEARFIEVTLELSDRDMEVFRNSTGELKPVFIAADLKLDGTNGQERQIFNNDYVKIQALLTCNVLTKKD